MKRLKRFIPVLAIIMASALGVLFNPSFASAKTVSDVKDKYVARGFWTCYANYMKNGISPAEVLSYNGIMTAGGKEKVVGLAPDTSSKLSDTEYSCDGLYDALGFDHTFTTNGGAAGSVTPDINGNVKRFTTLGYVADGTGSKDKCVPFNFGTIPPVQQGPSQIAKQASPEVCMTVSGDKIQKMVNPIPAARADATHMTVTVGMSPDDNKFYMLHANETIPLDVSFTANMTVNDLTGKLNTALSKYKCNTNGGTEYLPGGSGENGLCYMSKGDAHDNGGATSRYKLKGVEKTGDSSDASASYKVAYKNLYGKSSWPGITVSKEEQAALYQDFLVKYYGATKKGCAKKKDDLKDDTITLTSDDQANGWHIVKMYNDKGAAQYCYIGLEDADSKKVFGITTPHGNSKEGSPAMVSNGQIGAVEIMKWLNNNSPDKIDKTLAGSIGQAQEDSSEGDKKDEGDPTLSCFDGGGALGWVLCPVMEAASNAVNQIYEGFIEPALTINADLLAVNDGSDKDAYDVWQIFQTFANIAFAIMILVVIISQLTGVGIDNYGIKRILPRLIIAALLINLSFIICQLAVDISNILGVSLKNLFDGLGPSAVVSGSTASGNTAAWVTIIVSVVAVGGAFLALGLGVIIPILVAIISALIAVFFLFIVLAGRQAAVVILVVISPLALVMYMLPNTKKYFDKFIKIFATLLVVFPICGLVMGGGNFASRVLLAAGGASADSFNADGSGFFYQISAVLVGIVPFFFIPSLVKNSLAGLGNIGAKVSGIGSKVSGRATKTSRGALEKTRLGDPSKFSRWSNVRRAERRDAAERESNLRRAQSRVKRLSGRKNPSAADMRRLATAQSVVEKYGNEDFDARFSLAKDRYKDNTDDEVMDAWDKAFEAGDTAELGALTKLAHSRMGSNAAKQMADKMAKKTGFDENSDYQKSLGALRQQLENDGKLAGDFRSKAYDAHAMVTSGGVIGREGPNNDPVYAESMGHFSKTGKLDTIQDFSTQSTGALERAAAAGKLTPEMAEMIRTSDDPSVKSGIMSDADKAKIINDVANTMPQPNAGSGNNNSSNSGSSSNSTPTPGPSNTGGIGTSGGLPGRGFQSGDSGEFTINHNSSDRGRSESGNDYQDMLNEGGFNPNGGDV